MKKLFLLAAFCFYFSGVTFAQWQPCNGPYGGSVNGLLLKGQNIFALTRQQGVFLSSDNGSSWSPRNNGITNNFATVITMKGSQIFVGTSSGLFASWDEGMSWVTVLINGVANYPIIAIGSNTQSLFILTDNGLYRSNNDGNTWTPLFYDHSYCSIGINGNDIFVGSEYRTLYRSPDNGDNFASINLIPFGDVNKLGSFVFSGSSVFATGENGVIFKSTDNGDTWNQATNGISSYGVTTLAGNGNNLYAGCYNGNMYEPNTTGSGGIYISQDDGAHWTNLGMKDYSVEKIIFSGNRIIAGTYVTGIFISDDSGVEWYDSNNGLVRVPVLAVAKHGPDLIISSALSGPYSSQYLFQVMKSADSGMNWIRSDSGISPLPVTIFAFSNSFMLAAGTELFISYNNGLHWNSIFKPGYLIKALVISDTKIFVGTEGGIFSSDDEGNSWYSVNNGLSNNTVLSMIKKGSSLFAGTAEGIYKTVDNGATWTLAGDGLTECRIPAMAANDNFLFVSGLSTTSGIYRSADDGNTWVRTPVDNSLYCSVNCFTVENEKIIAGTSDPFTQVLFSNDNGDNWSVVNHGLPVNFLISSMVVLDSTVYAGIVENYYNMDFGSGVWKRQLSDFIPFSVSVDTLVMQETSGDIKTLGITSETPWNIEALLPAWLTVDKISGFGSDLLTFTTMEDNPNQQPRYTSMEAISMGMSRHVTIVQKPKLIGIDDPQVPALSIYPNPTSGSVLIETTPGFDKITLYNAPGQILSELPVVSSKTRMDLSQYGKGIYYIRLTGRKGTRVQQLVVL